MAHIRVGERIVFGQWEEEPITWYVLDVRGSEALLISEKVIDCVKYHEELACITWADCSLRRWLNERFFKRAFSSQEKMCIMTSAVMNPGNPKYGAWGGAATADSIFCLSIEEVQRYFDDKASRAASSSSLAKQTGVLGSLWWLRSPGDGQDYAAGVSSRGFVFEDGFPVNRDTVGVRPAMWVEIG